MPFIYKFAANLSTLFDEDDFSERFRRAKQLGFQAVEAQNLYHLNLDDLKAVKKETGLEVALINSPKSGTVDYFEGQGFGLACIPGQEVEFNKSLLKAIKYAHSLECKRIHILAGLKQDGICEEDLFRTYKQNMEAAADCLEEHNIVGLIEPICPQVKELYFLDNFDKAMNAISEIGSSHLQLLLDVYHLQMLEGDVEKGIKKYLKYAGHVQISQAPGREEPFYPGKIDYEKILEMLADMQYDGHIGLEYNPSDPENGFKWLESYRAV
ncbi:putative hydroxypyruvate isomerase [Argiope bruennichi]|uniref:Putative hydroxypyruvate isomerase n=1 Tax=Argiope bruennichi TaxID=94029 RepID=A0A8T0FGS3_ARGBR|nr:putative hydroxypyruvate isomerase [Argiope bruennichi]XP_055929475.1 putative hydroxypyruvate isomerase [Argiope bruennichi]KAF8790497.1 putative hydroxypyruvate isomerase like protein [Argiope bruennichi]